MSEALENNHAERIGKLETAFSNLAVSVNKLQEVQERIERAIADSGKTNWSVLFAGAGVLLSLVLVIYGAAIHPLSQNIERQEAGAAILACVSGICCRLPSGSQRPMAPTSVTP